jgi:hypothetical protein
MFFWVRYWCGISKIFFEFEIFLNWCWFLMFSENSFESMIFCKCFEAPYKTAKILSVKGSMNKSLQFCKSSSEWDITKSKGRYPSNQSYGENFYNHSTVPMRLLRLNPAISISSLRVKRCGIWTGSLSIKSNVLYWSTFSSKIFKFWFLH